MWPSLTSSAPPPPSVHDTHCTGAGLAPSTRAWSTAYKLLRKWDYMGYGVPDSRSHPTILPPHVDLRGKNVLITGGNSGLGFEAACVFAAWGAHVVLACRPTERVPKHEQPPDVAREQIIARGKGAVQPQDVEVWEVDMMDMDSVHALGQRWIASGRALDILCNNAGFVARTYATSQQGFDASRAVNYLSHCLLTLTVLPAMQHAAAPRIVNTCSCFHFAGSLDFANMDYEQHPGGPAARTVADGMQAYCDTKLYLMMWTRELQRRLSYSDAYRHVVVNGVHPGFVGTGIWQSPNKPSEAEMKTTKFKLLQHGLAHAAVTPAHGSLCILYGALLPAYGLPLEQVRALGGDRPNSALPAGLSARRGGNYLSRTWREDPRPECDDRLACSRLWQRTLEDVRAGERDVLPDVPGHPIGIE